MQWVTWYRPLLAQGKEIVCHKQGLTSVLCQKADSHPLNVVIYTQLQDQDDSTTIVGYDRNSFPLTELYLNARTNRKFEFWGGVAFLRFGLSYLCDEGAHDGSQALPPVVLPEVKVKLLGFHAMNAAGGCIDRITYKSKTAKRYDTSSVDWSSYVGRQNIWREAGGCKHVLVGGALKLK